MSVGDVFRLSVVGHDAAGDAMVNVVDVAQSSGAGTVAAGDLTAVIDQLAGWLLPILLPCIGTDYTLSKLILRGISGAVSSLLGESLTDAGAVGMGSDVAESSERCTLMRKYTGTGGRHGHGRLFVPMPPGGNFDSTGLLIVSPPDGAAFQDLANGYPNPTTVMTGVQMYPVIVNRATSAFLPVTSCSINALVGIQRRRRFGIGA